MVILTTVNWKVRWGTSMSSMKPIWLLWHLGPMLFHQTCSELWSVTILLPTICLSFNYILWFMHFRWFISLIQNICGNVYPLEQMSINPKRLPALEAPDHRWASTSGNHPCAHIKVQSWTVRTGGMVIPFKEACGHPDFSGICNTLRWDGAMVDCIASWHVPHRKLIWDHSFACSTGWRLPQAPSAFRNGLDVANSSSFPRRSIIRTGNPSRPDTETRQRRREQLWMRR